MTTRKLIVIFQYEHCDGSRVVFRTGRLLSVAGKSIPWFQLTRRAIVAAVASLQREIAQREQLSAQLL